MMKRDLQDDARQALNALPGYLLDNELSPAEFMCMYTPSYITFIEGFKNRQVQEAMKRMEVQRKPQTLEAMFVFATADQIAAVVEWVHYPLDMSTSEIGRNATIQDMRERGGVVYAYAPVKVAPFGSYLVKDERGNFQAYTQEEFAQWFDKASPAEYVVTKVAAAEHTTTTSDVQVMYGLTQSQAIEVAQLLNAARRSSGRELFTYEAHPAGYRTSFMAGGQLVEQEESDDI